MYKLQVEEFESRQLLNSTSFSPQRPLSQSFTAVTYALMVVERSPFVDYGGHGGPFGWGWPGEGGGGIGSFRSFAHPGFDGRGPEAPGSHAADRPSARPETRAGGAIRVGGEQPGGAPAAGGPETARINTGGMPPDPPVPASNIRRANEAAAIASEQPNFQAHTPLENPVSARGLPVQMQGYFAVRPPVWVIRGEEGSSGSTGNLGEGSWKADNESGMSTTGQAENESLLPSPRVSGVLASLPPIDLSALELGMQQFLEQLGELGPRLAKDGEGSGLWPWIVAVTAAATACEIARRELRRPVSVPAVEANGMSGGG